MYNRDSSPTVTSCSFSGNSGGFGGGMFNDNSNPTVSNCTFVGNTATATSGGGMASLGGSSPTVSNCAFIGNTSGCNGAGMLIIGGSSTVINCTFSGHSTNFGAGMLIAGGNSTVINCTFSGNSADFGGGMANTGGSQTVINCIFSGNSAISSGGGMFNFGGNQTVTDCTFAFNSAGNGNALGFDSGPSDTSIANCILWDGGDEIRNNDGSTITVAYSLVQGGFPGPPGPGNIDTDPLFVDPDNGDYRLSAGSPCIDAGDNTAVPAGITTDLDGNPRFVDDPKTIDSGNGDPPVVDIGAYEFQGASQCPWDCDGGESTDGTVGIDDFLALLAQWGSPGICDFDGGGVGINDFLELLANWGPCPG